MHATSPLSYSTDRNASQGLCRDEGQKTKLSLHERTAAETFLAVQWLRPCTSSAGGSGLIPGWGTQLPYALRYGQ